MGIEDTDSLFPPAYFDAIVSTSVLEEIYGIDVAFQKMDRLLRPGGYSIHKIDFRDYGMFTKHGFHPLEFLTVPDWAYRYMTESSGQPNRRMVNYYRGKMAELGYGSKILIAMVAGSRKRTTIRPGLS